MFKEITKKPTYFISEKIQVQDAGRKGNGVFAIEDIDRHEIIESAPIVIFHMDTYDTLYKIYGERHIMFDYPFEWGGDNVAFSLGYGGVYNHNIDPNAGWINDYENNGLKFITKKSIKKGEEITIRYIPKSYLKSLWFEVEDENSNF